MAKLLGIDSNPKTVKGQKQGYKTAILYLASYKAAGVNLCPMAEIAGCWQGCLGVASGMAQISKGSAKYSPYGIAIPDNNIQKSRVRKTRFWADSQLVFLAQLHKEIKAHIKSAAKGGFIPVVRLNGTSDIKWENFGIMEAFPDIQFYDYTKECNRKNLPDNYHLTLSYSEATENYRRRILAAWGMQPWNLAVVFRKDKPDIFLDTSVVDGDENDLRFLDPIGVVVGLKAKGGAKKDTSGFVV